MTILLLHETPKNRWTDLTNTLKRLRLIFDIISPKEAKEFLQNGHKGRKPLLLLSTDDGFQSNYMFCKKVLDSERIKGIFFVCPEIMNRELKDQSEMIRTNIQPPSYYGDRLMSWRELSDLQKKGHSIGSHTMSHSRLSSVSRNQIEQEVQGSSKIIYQKTATKPEWFAFPFGDANSITREGLSIISKTYSYCVSGVRGSNTTSTSKFGLRRQSISVHKSSTYQLLEALGCFDYWHLKPRKKLRKLAKLQTGEENQWA